MDRVPPLQLPSARVPFAFVWAMTLLVVGLPAAGCIVDSSCGCTACSNAIALAVVDAAGSPVTDGWSAEAALDGAVVDTSACDDSVRTGNQCAFGFDSGVYEIVIRTTTQERHLVARSAARVGQDCCVQCVPTETVPVVLGVD